MFKSISGPVDKLTDGAPTPTHWATYRNICLFTLILHLNKAPPGPSGDELMSSLSLFSADCLPLHRASMWSHALRHVHQLFTVLTQRGGTLLLLPRWAPSYRSFWGVSFPHPHPLFFFLLIFRPDETLLNHILPKKVQSSSFSVSRQPRGDPPTCTGIHPFFHFQSRDWPSPRVQNRPTCFPSALSMLFMLVLGCNSNSLNRAKTRAHQSPSHTLD